MPEFNAICALVDGTFYMKSYGKPIGEHLLEEVTGGRFDFMEDDGGLFCETEHKKYPGLLKRWKDFINSVIRSSVLEILEKEYEIRKERRETCVQEALDDLLNSSANQAEPLIRAIIEKISDRDISKLVLESNPIEYIIKHCF